MSELPEYGEVIEITGPGDADVLKPVARRVPQPGTNEVLIEVHAAGINRPDILQRQGLYPVPAGASDIPGLEVAGQVVALGTGVQNLGIGDAVCALTPGGGYAEYCITPAEHCLPLPAGFSMVQGAALPETFFTVWTNVFDRGQLRNGETLLVHGGSSGIGTAAIQMAKQRGATVIITAGNADKCSACLELGADRAINYKAGSFEEQVMEFTDNNGVDVILDMVAGPYFPRNLAVLATDGRLVQIALQQGAKSEINLGTVMRKRLTISGSTLRPRSVADKAAIADALRHKIWPLLDAGKIKPVIHTVFPFNQCNDAHRLMESGRHIGKIIMSRKQTDTEL